MELNVKQREYYHIMIQQGQYLCMICRIFHHNLFQEDNLEFLIHHNLFHLLLEHNYLELLK